MLIFDILFNTLAQPWYKMCHWTFLSCEICNEVMKLLTVAQKSESCFRLLNTGKFAQIFKRCSKVVEHNHPASLARLGFKG